MTFKLPNLPYPKNALEPYISEETLEYHYGKHHQTYVNNLNKLLEDAPQYQDKSLEEIIRTANGSLFNNAAQTWNHTFFWNSMSPDSGAPSKELRAALEKNFSSFDKFKEKFIESATANFGSGWTWLIQKSDSSLAIVNTSNAATPLHDKDLTPLLTVDIWEHAYYIDYRNARAKYLSNFWKVVNWNFVSENFTQANKK